MVSLGNALLEFLSFLQSPLGDDPLSKRRIPAFCSCTGFFIQETLTGQALHAWYLELNQTWALRGPRALAAQEGCRESQCWLCSQEPGLRTWLCHLPALASRTSSYTPLSLDFSTCTMGIKLIYFSGLLEEFKVIIQVHNNLYEFLGLRCVSEYFFF